ncbi:uncharacterized protein IUM83_02855 [Phytophthora cinnamomi]|uniref:uncharacterized protein n=1 Tax=Phytophthora cinnamomi TaxID=4785 RepID=UPI00355A766D|nr:hypothetical protein IUM83_02855 [Phytophthora cinnamomi]
MAEVYQFSRKRPHLALPPDNKRAKVDSDPQPSTTFTAFLNTVKLADTSPPPNEYVSKCDATPAPVSSAIKRRLRNRESCRKTRLKRKLQQQALDVLVSERQARNAYLTQLAYELGVDSSKKASEGGHNSLFREFATKSLHYALVDSEYDGWLDHGSSLSTSNAATTAEIAQESEKEAHPTTRMSKRLRRSRDIETATASRSKPPSPQASLLNQWCLLVDGLQNVALKVDQIEERDFGAGAFEQYCHWRFVGVSSVKVQRDGEIVAVAVTGTTRVKFRGRHVQDVDISLVRHESDVPFEFDADRDHNN